MKLWSKPDKVLKIRGLGEFRLEIKVKQKRDTGGVSEWLEISIKNEYSDTVEYKIITVLQAVSQRRFDTITHGKLSGLAEWEVLDELEKYVSSSLMTATVLKLAINPINGRAKFLLTPYPNSVVATFPEAEGTHAWVPLA